MNSGRGANGTEEPWSSDGPDLFPASQLNSKIARSTAWIESRNDLKPLSSPASDLYWTFSGGDLTPNSIP